LRKQAVLQQFDVPLHIGTVFRAGAIKEQRNKGEASMAVQAAASKATSDLAFVSGIMVKR
jgi:hypothetical protein